MAALFHWVAIMSDLFYITPKDRQNTKFESYKMLFLTLNKGMYLLIFQYLLMLVLQMLTTLRVLALPNKISRASLVFFYVMWLPVPRYSW